MLSSRTAPELHCAEDADACAHSAAVAAAALVAALPYTPARPDGVAISTAAWIQQVRQYNDGVNRAARNRKKEMDDLQRERTTELRWEQANVRLATARLQAKEKELAERGAALRVREISFKQQQDAAQAIAPVALAAREAALQTGWAAVRAREAALEKHKAAVLETARAGAAEIQKQRRAVEDTQIRVQHQVAAIQATQHPIHSVHSWQLYALCMQQQQQQQQHPQHPHPLQSFLHQQRQLAPVPEAAATEHAQKRRRLVPRKPHAWQMNATAFAPVTDDNDNDTQTDDDDDDTDTDTHKAKRARTAATAADGHYLVPRTAAPVRVAD